MNFLYHTEALVAQTLHLHAGIAPVKAALPDFPDIAVNLLNG